MSGPADCKGQPPRGANAQTNPDFYSSGDERRGSSAVVAGHANALRHALSRARQEILRFLLTDDLHGWPLFLIAVLAAVYALQFVLDRLEQIVQRPLEKIEQRLFAIDALLHEANRHRERLIGRIDRLPEPR